MKNGRKFASGYLLIALALILIGVCFIAFNSNSMEIFGYVAGGITLVAALVFVLINWLKGDRGFMFAVKAALGVAGVLCGIAIMLRGKTMMEYVFSVFAVLIMIDASLKLNSVMKLKDLKNAAWWLMLIFIVFAIIGNACVLKFYDGGSESAKSIFMGIVMLDSGILNILYPFFDSWIKKREENRVVLEVDLPEKKDLKEVSEEKPDAEMKEIILEDENLPVKTEE